ncbi:hypothetical protein [Actinoplanes sp. URMC 104]|uniref:hypothetical protein n=1 Tax=Actinoplanes sp. URMC 104 TaxID=3423409 RepID=UPI003F1D76DB
MPPYKVFHPKELNKWIKQTAYNIECTKVVRVGERSFVGTMVRQAKAEDGYFAAELDAAGRLTRVSSGFGESADDMFVIQFSDFGVPVTVEPPAASEVIGRPGFATVAAGIL